jgi:hypothetical protein
MFLGLGSYTVAILALHLGINPLWLARSAASPRWWSRC